MSRVLCVALVLAVLSTDSNAQKKPLRCFQCATTDMKLPCRVDYEGFINASLGLSHHDYITDCDSRYDRCMIETLEKDGLMNHYHRGCHDGKTFDTKFDNHRFYDIVPRNQTECAMMTTLACYTFCNTDLCNGPQPVIEPPDPCANITTGEFEYYDDLPFGCRAGGTGAGLGLVVVAAVVAWILN